MSWLIIILTILAIVLLFFAYYVGFFDMRKADVRVLKPYHFLYTEVQCDYMSLFTPFYSMIKDVNEQFQADEFCLSGIYFDNPTRIVDKNLCRSAIGVLLRGEAAIAKAKEFAKTSDKYTLIELPEITGIHMGFPDRGTITFFFAWIYWRKIFALKKEKKLEIGGRGEFVGVEFYEKYLEERHHYYLPISGDVDAYRFSTIPQPEMKA